MITPKLINRAALLVRPRQPYIDWAASLDEEAPEQAKTLASRVSVYLVAEDPEEKAETAPVERYYKCIFEHELESWWLDEKDWPRPRSFEMFSQWFEVVGESVVTDLESKPIRKENLE